MGSCCSKKPKIIMINSPDWILKERRASVPLSTEEISHFVEGAALVAEQQFHNSIKGKLKEPLSWAQIDIILKGEHRKLETSFCQTFSGTESLNSVPSDVIKSRLEALQEKCKATEVYYRYLNDQASYEFYVNLKKSLLKQLLNNELQADQLVTVYQTQAKGSFGLQGLQDIHEILETYKKNPEDVKSLVDKQAQVIAQQLQEQYLHARTLFKEHEADIHALLAVKSAVPKQEEVTMDASLGPSEGKYVKMKKTTVAPRKPRRSPRFELEPLSDRN